MATRDKRALVPDPNAPPEPPPPDAEFAPQDAPLDDPGTWGDAKAIATGGILGGGGDVQDAMRLLSGYGPLSDAYNYLFGGGGDDGKAAQTALAKEVTAPSTANAQSLYELAVQNALAQQGVAITPMVSTQTTLDPNAFRDTSNTTATAMNAAPQMRGYEAAIAQAADATSRLQAAPITRAANVPGAVVADIDTRVSAPTIGPAAQTKAVAVDRVAVDPGADAIRQEQLNAARAIAAGPSSAATQFKADQSQVVADQLAIAAAARGAESAGARREAMIAAGQQGSGAALAAAALAAREEQAKREASAAAMAGIRGQDVGLATKRAEIAAQQSNLEAQLNTAIAQGNTVAINTIKQRQAELATEARKAEVAAGLTQQGTQAQLAQANLTAQQQTSLANMAAANKASADYAAAVNAAAGQTAQSQTAVSLANAGSQTKAAQDYAAAVNAAQGQFAQNATQVSQSNATLTQKQAAENAARALEASKTQQATELATTAANADAYIRQKQLQATTANDALTTAINATNTQARNAQTITDANKAQAEADTQKEGALIAAGGSIISAVASDKDAKRDIEPISEDALMDLADHVRAVSYRYRPGYEDDGEYERAGELANEVEKAALGKKLVHRRPDGIREMDYAGLYGMMAAAAALAARKSEKGGARG